MPEGCKVAVVAALEREVRPLVRNWRTTRKEYSGREFKFFEKQDFVVVCGGMGSEAARWAAEAVIRLYRPMSLVSAGFAGALAPALCVGQVLSPRFVIDAADGSRTERDDGEGILVTFSSVADAEQKAKFAKAYGADAVDMEAAAVAKAAAAHGVRFLCCKAISDVADSSLPPVARFVGSDGRFHAAKFLAFVAIRPWRWLRVAILARDTAIAAEKLCEVIKVNQFYCGLQVQNYHRLAPERSNLDAIEVDVKFSNRNSLSKSENR